MERIVVTNLYGGSNPRGPAVRAWLKDLDPNVVMISELGRLSDDLRPLGRVVRGNQNDVGTLVMKGKVDAARVKKLTNHINRSDRPLFWRARYYIRVKINNRVYYTTHGNAAIQSGGRWLDNAGAKAWRQAMKELRNAIEDDIDKGFAVRVGGDFNFGHAKPPAPDSPGDMFQDLGLNWMRHNVDWLAWDPRYDKVKNKRVIGKAPGADAHQTLVLTLEEKKKPTPNEKDKNAGRNKSDVKIVTTPLGPLNPNQVGEELTKVRKEIDPDLWMLQGTKDYLPRLRNQEGYGVGVARRQRSHAVLFKRSVFRLVGADEITVQDDRIVVVNLLHRASDSMVSVITSNIDVKGEKGKAELRRFANLVAEQGKGARLVFWGGRFDVDPDKAKIFKEAGLESAFGELDKDVGTRDYIGSFKGDKRVIAKAAVRNKVADRQLTRALYTLSTLRKPDGPRDGQGTATDPEEIEEAGPAKQKFQKDEGATIDHEECCGGYGK